MEAGDGAEEGAGGLADTLGVDEVTWFLVGDFEVKGVGGCWKGVDGQEFGDVAYLGAEMGGALGVERVVMHEVGVFF